MPLMASATMSNAGRFRIGAAVTVHAPEAGYDGPHQLRIERPHILVAEAHFAHGAGAQVLHHHVGAQDQLLKDLLPAGVAQVQRQALFVAVVAHEARRLPGAVFFGEGRHGAPGVAAARTLDLDDLGAGIGQQQSAIGAGHVLLQTGNPDARQGPVLGLAQPTNPRSTRRWWKPPCRRRRKASPDRKTAFWLRARGVSSRGSG